jgi:hypothetical protein
MGDTSPTQRPLPPSGYSGPIQKRHFALNFSPLVSPSTQASAMKGFYTPFAGLPRKSSTPTREPGERFEPQRSPSLERRAADAAIVARERGIFRGACEEQRSRQCGMAKGSSVPRPTKGREPPPGLGHGASLGEISPHLGLVLPRNPHSPRFQMRKCVCPGPVALNSNQPRCQRHRFPQQAVGVVVQPAGFLAVLASVRGDRGRQFALSHRGNPPPAPPALHPVRSPLRRWRSSLADRYPDRCCRVGKSSSPPGAARWSTNWKNSALQNPREPAEATFENHDPPSESRRRFEPEPGSTPAPKSAARRRWVLQPRAQRRASCPAPASSPTIRCRMGVDFAWNFERGRCWAAWQRRERPVRLSGRSVMPPRRRRTLHPPVPGASWRAYRPRYPA